MAKKTTKKTTKSAAKKRAVASKPVKQRKPRRRGEKRVEWATSGALTPRASKRDAAIAPVSSFAGLVGYWDLLLKIYRVVAIKGVELTAGRLSFKILHPDTGVAFNDGQVFMVTLEDGEKTYPGFPSTGHLINPNTDFKYGYLLLSREWLDQALGEDVETYSSPKKPVGAAL